MKPYECEWWDNVNKKLSYCCDSRSTACSILTLFIVTATSRPLNKKKSVCCQSAESRIQQLLRICVRNTRSAHLCLHLQSAQALVGGRTEWHRVIVDNEPTRTLSPVYTVVAFLTRVIRFFVVHLVAKRYILQQKCQKGQIGTCMLGARWNNF